MSTKRQRSKVSAPNEPEEANPRHDLHTEIEAARVLLATYRDILDGDEQAKADMVEGQTDLDGAVRRAVARLAELKVMREGLKTVIGGLQARDARFEVQEKQLRVAIQVALEIAGRKRFETDLATLSRAATPRSVVITDEALVPSQYFKRGDPRISKTLIREAIEAGEEVPGAGMSNGGETLHLHWS